MAYTNVWDDTLPTGSEAANTLDDILRGMKVDLEERFSDIFAIPDFTVDPLRPYGLKFTDAQDSVITLGDNAGTARTLFIKDKAKANTYLGLDSVNISSPLNFLFNTPTTGSAVVNVRSTAASPYNLVLEDRNSIRAWALSVDLTIVNDGIFQIRDVTANLARLSIDSTGVVSINTGLTIISGTSALQAVTATSLVTTATSTMAAIQGTTIQLSTSIRSPFFQEDSPAAAGAGAVRLVNTSKIMSRNAANSADVNMMYVDGIDVLRVGAQLWAEGGKTRFIYDTAANLGAGAAGFNGVIAVDSTNNRFIYYSGGNRYYLTGTAF